MVYEKDNQPCVVTKQLTEEVGCYSLALVGSSGFTLNRADETERPKESFPELNAILTK